MESTIERSPRRCQSILDRRLARRRPLLWAFVAVLAGVFLFLPVRESHAESPTPTEIVRQVQGLIRSGNPQEARELLDRAVRTYPQDAGLRDLLGIVEAQQGKLAEAEENFKRSIELDPRLAGAYLNLAHVYQQQIGKEKGAARNAVAVYRKLLAIDPGNVEANFQLSLLLEQRGDFKSSLVHLERLPVEARKNSRARLVSVADHAGLGQRSIAEREASTLQADRSLNEADVLAILPALKAGHAPHLGIELLEGLARQGRASPAALYRLGVLYEDAGQLSKARSVLEKVAQSKPASVPILLELARVAEKQKEYKHALGYLAHARDLAPDDASIHFFFGVVCVEANLGQEAYVSLRKAVELDPGNPYYNYALGAVVLARTDTHPAIGYFQRYCQAMPHDPRGRFALGVAYFYSHDLKSAQKVLEEVTSFRQTAPGAHYFLGRIADLEGRLDQAAAQLALSLRERPGYADALAELGIVRIKRKEYPAAREALEAALRKDPNNYRANLNLMILYARTKDPRAKAQRERFQELQKTRAQTAKDFLRTIKVERPTTAENVN